MYTDIRRLVLQRQVRQLRSMVSCQQSDFTTTYTVTIINRLVYKHEVYWTAEMKENDTDCVKCCIMTQDDTGNVQEIPGGKETQSCGLCSEHAHVRSKQS